MVEKQRLGDWVQTASGTKVWPLDARVEEILLSDIAQHLSNLCRFTGACRKFYSVAQHCVLVSKLCPPEHAMWGLLHDAAEAYIGDLPRPLKHSGDGNLFGKHYQEVEERLLGVIAERFGLVLPIPQVVQEADRWMLAAEARDLMDDPDWAVKFAGTHPSLAKVPTIRPWKPRRARVEFLLWFYSLRTI